MLMSDCETRPSFATWTFDDETAKLFVHYRIAAVYTHVADTPPSCSITDRLGTTSCGDDPNSDLHNNLTIGTSCEDLCTTIVIRAGSGAASPGTVIYIWCKIDSYQVAGNN